MVSFYSQFGPVQKFQNVPKYKDRDCLKTFLLVSTFSMMVQQSRKGIHFGSKMSVLSKKQLIGKIESFQKSNFDLDQIYKIVLRQNH